MAMDAIVAKFELGSDIRRTRLAEVSCEAVRAAALQAFGDAAGDKLELRYADDEGDWCTLTAQTFDDFADLNRGKLVLRLKVVNEAPAVVPPQEKEEPDAADAVDTTMADDREPSTAAPPEAAQASPGATQANEPFNPCWSPRMPWWPHGHRAFRHHHHMHWRHHGEHHLRHLASMFLSGGHLPAMLAHVSPWILQQLEAHKAPLDRFFAQHREALLPVVVALREGLEPFPQFQEARLALDRLRHDASADGAGDALCNILRNFEALPQDQRRDAAASIFGGVVARLAEILPALMAAAGTRAAAEEVHHRVVCDGCDDSPILGQRWKCKDCRDYDLCSACYSRKDQLHHPEHTFEAVPAFGCHDWFKGAGKGKHCGMGWGKGLGKSWGKGWGKHCGMGWGKGHGKSWWGVGSSNDSDSSPSTSSGEEPRGAAKLHKHEKHRYRTERKAAKRQMKAQIKEAKRVYKQEKRRWKRELHETKARAKDRSAEVDNSPALYGKADSEESPLKRLVDMGFDNIELLSQLLEHNAGDVHKVLEALLGPTGLESSDAIMVG